MSTVPNNGAGLPVLEHQAGPVDRPTCSRETFMSQSNARAFRTEMLVLTEDATPRAMFAEFLNNLEEHEELAVLAWLRTPEFNAYAVCREVAMDLPEEWGAAS